MDILELLEHVLVHSVADTLYLVPFLFITYVVMEWLEHKTGSATQETIRRSGAAGPLIGALLGIVPQCGFSASAATLYSGRVITLGTLVAVFLSTSDEMLPIFVAQKVPPVAILTILGVKLVVGMVFGFIIDSIMRMTRRGEPDLKIHELCRNFDCGCERNCATCQQYPELAYEHTDDCPYGCDHSQHVHDHSHDHSYGWGKVLKSALMHTLHIVVFIFLITLVLNLILEVAGEDVLASILGGDSISSILLSTLVGLIPNCAASLVIAELYVEGVLGSGAMLAGLLCSAGIGLLVLFRTNRPASQNILILVGVYAISALCGVICASLGIVFF